eukprot:1001668_1
MTQEDCKMLNRKAYDLFERNWQSVKSTAKEDRPNQTNNCKPVLYSVATHQMSIQCIHHKPNVFLINNFLNDFEISHLLNISRNNTDKFQHSYTQSANTSYFQRIYSQKRTSTNLFLQKSMDKIIHSIENRAANIVGSSIKSVEQLQLLRYTNGQHFHLHHDSGTLINETVKKQIRNNTYDKNINSISSVESNEYSIEAMLPMRLFSFFVYLTDLPLNCGGETCFPKIGLKIRPKRGAAALWCNVDTNNINKCNPMLIHKATPVKGNYEKIGMNIWIQ